MFRGRRVFEKSADALMYAHCAENVLGHVIGWADSPSDIANQWLLGYETAGEAHKVLLEKGLKLRTDEVGDMNGRGSISNWREAHKKKRDEMLEYF